MPDIEFRLMFSLKHPYQLTQKRCDRIACRIAVSLVHDAIAEVLAIDEDCG
jgi:hypothetical protein